MEKWDSAKIKISPDVSVGRYFFMNKEYNIYMKENGKRKVFRL